MSRFSRSEAEANGWVIVHEDDDQSLYRAEKYVGDGKVEQSGVSEGKLLEAINAYEEHLASSVEVEPARVDESGMPVDEDGNMIRSVVAPNDEELTDAEWSHRGVSDAIYDDGDMRLEGATPAAQEAVEARDAISQEKENARTAEPDVGPTETLNPDSRDRQLQDVLVVRKGEESLAEVVDRKLEESADAEAERSAAGIGIGPMDLDADGNLVPPGGKSEIFDPRDLPGGVDSGEEVAQVRADAEIEEATALRDEHGKAADKPELAGEVAAAGSEAQQELADKQAEEGLGERDPDNAEEDSDEEKKSEDVAEEDPEAEEAKDSEHVDLEPGESVEVEAKEAPEATPAAEELAKEKEVDLSQVEGSGKDGKIIKSDVEAVASEESDPAED